MSSDDPARILLDRFFILDSIARTLTAAYAEAADLGEAYATARRLTHADGERWCSEWSATATRVRGEAEDSLARGHRRSARLGLLRASEYWRQAFYFVRHDLDAPVLQQTYAAHRDSFVAALDLFDHPAELVRVPYADDAGATTLRGYFFSPDDSGRRRATLVFPAATTRPPRRAGSTSPRPSPTATTQSSSRGPARARRSTCSAGTSGPTGSRCSRPSSTGC